MAEDPRYLENESRFQHRLHRRMSQSLRWFMLVWFTFISAWTAAAIVDVIGDLGWGYSVTAIWVGVGFLAFGGLLWLAVHAMLSFLLAATRRLYGPDPDEREN